MSFWDSIAGKPKDTAADAEDRAINAERVNIANAEQAGSYGQAMGLLQQNTAAQQSALGAVKSLGGGNEFDRAAQAGTRAIQLGGAKSLSAQGSRYAGQGAGGYGAAMDAGLSGGVAEADFQAKSTINKANFMQANAQAQSQAGEALGNAGQAQYGMEQENPLSIANSQKRQADWATRIASNVETNLGWYDDEEAYEAAWAPLFKEAQTAEELQWLTQQKAGTDKKAYMFNNV